jgi:hypothetical protein
MSKKNVTASIAEKMKKIQIGDQTRDYLVLWGQLQDVHQRFIDLLSRDFGQEMAEEMTMNGFVECVGKMGDKITDAMRQVMVMHVDTNEPEL